jgi:hypothetical protein
MADYETEIQKHRAFATDQHIRVNKLLAEHDPLYNERYQEKRRLILVQIETVSYEIVQIKEKLERKNKQHSEIVSQLEDLDQARKNWEPM